MGGDGERLAVEPVLLMSLRGIVGAYCRRKTGRLPAHARVVFFYGGHDPSRDQPAWVKEHWQ